ncbi:hypothetical protein [Clostridium scatologenes]|uniref:Uncharacterized protein n=1 Tax=Clostridium scatologenes TaxID=1548 RepID=A0A0E3M7S8_CLOSL|nr:hypothetical protein [Clostridium scatologenes]AKA71003.1 hypothetical protein CSCA_3878 [Clostridium scatologenes]
MNFGSLINAYNTFNSYSLNKINLNIKKISQQESFIRALHESNCILMRNHCEVTYEIENKKEKVKHIITVPLEFAIEGFEFSKLMCNQLSIRVHIHSIIALTCQSLIDTYNKGVLGWIDYLSNWNENKYLSVYKSYDEATKSKDRFIHSLKAKLKEYLRRYYPLELSKINELNLQLDDVNKTIRTIIEKNYLTINTDIYAGNTEVLYDYDFR